MHDVISEAASVGDWAVELSDSEDSEDPEELSSGLLDSDEELCDCDDGELLEVLLSEDSAGLLPQAASTKAAAHSVANVRTPAFLMVAS